MRKIVKYIIENLPTVEPQGSHEEVEELELIVENEDLFSQFTVEVTTTIEDLFPGDYESPAEYTSSLQVDEPKIVLLEYKEKTLQLTPHEWKEVKKAIINNIDTHGCDDVQN